MEAHSRALLIVLEIKSPIPSPNPLHVKSTFALRFPLGEPLLLEEDVGGVEYLAGAPGVGPVLAAELVQLIKRERLERPAQPPHGNVAAELLFGVACCLQVIGNLVADLVAGVVYGYLSHFFTGQVDCSDIYEFRRCRSGARSVCGGG